jgi:Ser-tRNA(Ala) deacylase AlaX
MHVVNAVARRQFGGILTGVQIGPDRSRIDFKLAGFSREQIPDFENRVNEVSERPRPITSSIISENEYRRRPELIGTLNVLPPIANGTVRIVEIEGFDAQACGATHVHSTSDTAPPDYHWKEARDDQLVGVRCKPRRLPGYRHPERDADAGLCQVDTVDQGRQSRSGFDL